MVRAYHQTCTEVMQRFDGYVAQYLGDGVLVYFGYPVAHEDDAQRAVRAGWHCWTPSRPLAPPGAASWRAGGGAAGGAYGPGGGGRRRGGDRATSRWRWGRRRTWRRGCQHLAAPNTLVISAATQQLVARLFPVQGLGRTHAPLAWRSPLRCIASWAPAGPRVAWQVAATPRPDAPGGARAGSGPPAPSAGRSVTEGMGQVVLLRGEAGIGKSRLVQVLKEHVADAGHAWLECQGSPYYQHTRPLPPHRAAGARLLRCDREASAGAEAPHLEEFVAAAWPAAGGDRAAAWPLSWPCRCLLPMPPCSCAPDAAEAADLARAPAAPATPGRAQQPLLLVMEDLHWVDPSTLEWLSLLVDQGPTARILTLCTCRPDFSPPWTGRSHSPR